MSTWDECCKNGKFNLNFAKSQKTAETLRKIERPQEKETAAFHENELLVSNAYSNKKDENFAAVKNTTTTVETRFSFSDLGLNDHLLKWIESLAFSLPNRVQNEVLYHLSEGRPKHTVIKAPKKSGKTSAALIWVLNKLLCEKNKEYPKALVICPTIEITHATYKFLEKVSNYCEIKICLAIKGKKLSKGEQVAADLVIATPDKALELSKSTLNLKNAKYLIFDDAHCLSDAEGHLKTLSHVLSLLSSRCCIILCTLFCNQLLNDFIEKKLLQNQRIEIDNILMKVCPKEIFVVYSSNEERIKALMHLEDKSYKGQTVVFCKTKYESNRLKTALDDANISVEILNGDIKSVKRKDIFQHFKENKIKLLITTYNYMEVLEAENVTKVINYEQVLNSEHKLERHCYEQIENQLNGRKNCLIGSFIEQKWEDALIKPKPGSIEEPVYPNATVISATELIAGQFL